MGPMRSDILIPSPSEPKAENQFAPPGISGGGLSVELLAFAVRAQPCPMRGADRCALLTTGGDGKKSAGVKSLSLDKAPCRAPGGSRGRPANRASAWIIPP